MRYPSPATVRWTMLVTLLALWEFVPTTGVLPELFLPALSKTLTVLWIDRHIYFADTPTPSELAIRAHADRVVARFWAAYRRGPH